MTEAPSFEVSPTASEQREPALRATDLTVSYATPTGPLVAVDSVSFEIASGASLGLVGESGSGKSSMALALMKILPAGTEVSGSVRVGRHDVLTMNERQLREVRGREVAMIFQGAMNSWNPVLTIGRQLREGIEVHPTAHADVADIDDHLGELLAMVALDRSVLRAYPHQLSGGMRQRAGIALALACSPSVLLADEPTTALDVITQDRIVKLIARLQTETGVAMLFITHDLALASEITDRIAIMYAGRIAETGETSTIFSQPRHPYTRLLLGAIPSVHGERKSLRPLLGEPADPRNPPPGCRFHPRCPLATARCVEAQPPLVELSPGHHVACWHHEQAASVTPIGGTTT